MRAIVMEGPGAFGLRDVSMPEPGPGEVRVLVHAAGVNRADLLQSRGLYPAPPDAPSDIFGLEIAGVIDAIGQGVVELRPGDRVYGLVGGGGYAEAVVVHARTLAKIPERDGVPLPFIEAAAIPEASVTAYDAMVSQAGLSPGETVLIHAAGSGVGTAASQIAAAMGAVALGTARSQDKLDRARSLGLSAGLCLSPEGAAGPHFADFARAHTDGRGVEVVLDLVGGAYVPEDLLALRERGRLIVVGLTAGPRTELDLSILLRKRLRVFGTVLRSRPLEEKIALGQVLARHISPLVARRKLTAVIDEVMPLERASDALSKLATNATFGKIVLEVRR
jgi:NADPH2:quinone reductase